MITKLEALKQFFSSPEKPLTAKELLAFAKADPKGYAELGALAAQALGENLV